MTRMMKIDAISVNGRHRKDMGDLDALAASIADVGFLQPVAVDGKGKLIDGARRLEAAKQLGRESVPVHKGDDLDDVLRLMAERDANVCRKDFTPSEAVALGAQLEEMERKAARKRQSQAGPANGRGKKATGSGNLPEAVRGNTRDRVGAALGMSGKTYERAKEVVQAAKQNPAEFGEFVEEMDRTENVMQAYGKLYRRRREIEGERLARTMPIAQDQGIITGDMGVLWDRLEDNS